MRARDARITRSPLAPAPQLTHTRELLADSALTDEQRQTLQLFERTFGCYIMESAEAREQRAECMRIEGGLEAARNTLALGADIDGKFVEMSSVGLRSRMRVDADEGGARRLSPPCRARRHVQPSWTARSETSAIAARIEHSLEAGVTAAVTSNTNTASRQPLQLQSHLHIPPNPKS